MANETNSLSNYNINGMDDEELLDNNEELLRYIFGDDDSVDSFANQTIYFKNSHKIEKSANNNVEPHFYTKEQVKDRIIYAMRDSMKMTTREFVVLYNPTGLTGASRKHNVLYCVDEYVESILGNIDLDWAVTLTAYSFGFLPSQLLYPPGKAVWNLTGKKKSIKDQYNSPAEKIAKKMANLMIYGHMKFHEFFPLYLGHAKNPNYSSFEFINMTERYGKN